MNGSFQSTETVVNSEVRHMNRAFGSPRGPWWRNLRLTPAMGIAAAVLVAGYFGAKYFRGADVAKAEVTQGTLRVNLNTATLTELESIPGIGTVLAKQIVANRPYAAVEDLLNGRIQAALMDELPANNAIENGRAVKKAGTHGQPDQFGVAMRKEDKELQKLVNEGYKKLMADPYWKELQQKYLSK